MRTELGQSAVSGISILGAGLLLAAGVAAAVSAVSVRVALEKVPRIASVRLAELTADYVAKAAREHEDNDDAAEAVRSWAGRLEEALVRTAERHGVVLLPATAVAAGAQDLTFEVRAAMQAMPPKNPSPTTPEEER